MRVKKKHFDKWSCPGDVIAMSHWNRAHLKTHKRTQNGVFVWRLHLIFTTVGMTIEEQKSSNKQVHLNKILPYYRLHRVPRRHPAGCWWRWRRRGAPAAHWRPLVCWRELHSTGPHPWAPNIRPTTDFCCIDTRRPYNNVTVVSTKYCSSTSNSFSNYCFSFLYVTGVPFTSVVIDR